MYSTHRHCENFREKKEMREKPHEEYTRFFRFAPTFGVQDPIFSLMCLAACNIIMVPEKARTPFYIPGCFISDPLLLA